MLCILYVCIEIVICFNYNNMCYCDIIMQLCWSLVVIVDFLFFHSDFYFSSYTRIQFMNLFFFILFIFC